MSLMRLMVANLWRKPARTLLTFSALAVAFLLFMLLRAIAAAFEGGMAPEGLDRVIVDSRYSLTDNLPLSFVEQIRGLDTVDEVTHMTWFSGYVREPANTFAIHPVEPYSYFDVVREHRITPEAFERFTGIRAGAVASAALARRFGWAVGDVIPLRSDLYPKADGSLHWPLTLTGTFEPAEGEKDRELLLFHYDHYNESVADWAKNQVYWITARAASPDQLAEAVAEIDGLFENSSHPTRTTPEDEYRRQFARQLGDIGAITTMILGAVFFTIVLVTGNTVLQAYRERIPELAVLRTLGFPDVRLALLMLGEPCVLCLLGAVAGIAAAVLLEPGLNASLGAYIGRFETSGTSVAQALGVATLLGLVVGLPPAVAAGRRSIVDGLREG